MYNKRLLTNQFVNRGEQVRFQAYRSTEAKYWCVLNVTIPKSLVKLAKWTTLGLFTTEIDIQRAPIV